MEESVKKVIAPAGAEVNSNYLKLGDKFVKSFFLLAYPRFLSTGWFEPIINMAEIFDIAIFVNPVDTGTALKNLRKKSAQIESQILTQQDKGLVRDPMLETARDDIESLRDTLQQAQEKLFSVGAYISVYGDTLDEIAKLESKIVSMMETQLIYVKPSLFQQLEGFFSVLPIAEDKISITTPMDSGPLSSFFPFVSEDLTSDKGIMYGINRHNNNLIIFDRFSLENANQVVFAKSGSGKSVRGNEPVLVRRNGNIQLMKIGTLIEKEIKQKGITYRDEELEGVLDPGIEVMSFNKDLKTEWSPVSVAARKKATDMFYAITTRSGRHITTTGDHNMVVLKNGEVVIEKTSAVKEGDVIPLPRSIESTMGEAAPINLLNLLCHSASIYVLGANAIVKNNYDFLKHKGVDAAYDRYLYLYAQTRVIPIRYFMKVLSILGIETSNPCLVDLKLTSKTNQLSRSIYLPITDELLRILGYITSEGAVTKNAILIANIDPEVLTDIASSLDAMGVHHYKIGNGIGIAERPFVEMVKALGGAGTSAKKHVPSFIFGLPKPMIAQYLAAYFEGDGGVDGVMVAALSKSKTLIGELSYLLLYFGIVARIAIRRKNMARTGRKRSFRMLTISGANHIETFHRDIGFISKRKQELLSSLTGKKGNTNIDVIPGIHSIVEEISTLFSFRLHGIPEISPLARGINNPSPEHLLSVVEKIEQRVHEFELWQAPRILKTIPNLNTVVTAGANNKNLNRELWEELGQSWRLMKHSNIEAGAVNVLKAATITHKADISLESIKKAIHESFLGMDLSIKAFNPTLQSALIDRPQSSTAYQTLEDAATHALDHYKKICTTAIPRVRELLARLRLVAEGGLMWDPITRIEVIKNTSEPYVYDLTVDNEVFLAGYGGMFVHNSYATKLEIIRSLMMGVDVIVIDPENEYQRLAEAFGGSYFNISLSSPEHINPFDIPVIPDNELPGDVLRSHIVNLAGLMKLMLGKLTSEEDAIMDRAITETYASREITPEEDFKNAQPPLLSDLETVLRNLDGGRELADRMYKFTKGSFSGFLNQTSNVDINNRFIIFSIRDLEEELRPIAMYVILNFIWNLIRAKLKQRILIVDEAWIMMKEESSAAFLFGLVKRARKYYLGISTITQDVEDFLRSPFGRPIITNSSLQLLLKQAPATIDILTKAFDLTEAEKALLLGAEVGTGLFFAGRQHVAIQIVPSYFEDKLITTDPKQLLEEHG